jgi:hypothetical protein
VDRPGDAASAIWAMIFFVEAGGTIRYEKKGAAAVLG